MESFLQKYVYILLFLLGFTSCGGGSQCGFEFSKAFNGERPGIAYDSIWRCFTTSGRFFALVIFLDSQGKLTITFEPLKDSSHFNLTWEETGCGEVQLSSTDGRVFIAVGLEGSRQEKTLSGTFTTNDLLSGDFSCEFLFLEDF